MAAEPPERRPPPPPDREAMSDFDHVDRITARFLYWARPALLVGLPVWLVLLLLVPNTGLGPMPSLALSSLVALGVVVAAERLWRRVAPARRAPGTPEGDRPAAGRRARKRPMSPLLAVVLTLAGVALFVYVIFIVTIIVRGG